MTASSTWSTRKEFDVPYHETNGTTFRLFSMNGVTVAISPSALVRRMPACSSTPVGASDLRNHVRRLRRHKPANEGKSIDTDIDEHHQPDYD